MTASDHFHASDRPIELRVDPATRAILDIPEGIERVMGDRSLYARMLQRFRHDYRYGVDPIRRALAASDTALGHRLTHTLKGACGMIGAHPLHGQACELECAIRTGTGAPQGELDKLEREMSTVLRLIDVLIAGPAPAVPVPVRALLADGPTLDKLVGLLRNGDGAAIDLLEESGASLRVILGEGKLQAVMAAAARFDFEAALRALDSED